MNLLVLLVLVVISLGGCKCTTYQVNLIPEKGMNFASNSAVLVDLVWVMEEEDQPLKSASARQWFEGGDDEDEKAMRDGRGNHLIIRTSVTRDDAQKRLPIVVQQWIGRDNQDVTHRLRPPKGYSGFKVFVQYEQFVGELTARSRSGTCRWDVILKKNSISMEPRNSR